MMGRAEKHQKAVRLHHFSIYMATESCHDEQTVWEMVHAKIGAESIIYHLQLNNFLFLFLLQNEQFYLYLIQQLFCICLGETVGNLGVHVTTLNLWLVSICVTAEKMIQFAEKDCEFVHISSAPNILTALSLQFTSGACDSQVA